MATISFSFNLSSADGLASLNRFLVSRSYIVGFSATKADLDLVAAMGSAPDAAKYPHLARYYSHITSLSDAAKRAASGEAGIPVVAGAAAAAAPAAAGAGGDEEDEEDDDDDDLFGDDDEDDAEVAAAVAAAAAAAKDKKKPKKKKIAKSSIIWEINGSEPGQDMAALEADVRAIAINGLQWTGEWKTEDLAFGIQKLVAQCIIEDEAVEVQDVEDALEGLENAMSARIFAFNKV